MRTIRHILTVLLLTGVAAGCASTGAVPRPFPRAELPRSSPRPDLDAPAEPAAIDAVVANALSFRGVPYRNGGSDPDGFDCSGLVQYVFSRVGRALPREVRDQYRQGLEIDRHDIRAGDLVFFETVSRGASHVGLAIDRDQFVHAPSSRGVVRVERLSSDYWSRRFVGVRRIDVAATALSSRR